MIKKISFVDYLPRMKIMFETHWEEVASNKHSRDLNIDEDLFFELEKRERLLSLGAFVDDKLVGYSINILSPDTHDKTKVLCTNDALYISPEFRKGSLGVKLINQTEEEAKTKQCYCVVWHAKLNSPLDRLLERLEYTATDILYMKEL